MRWKRKVIWEYFLEKIYRHHVQERQISYVPQESSFPIPLKYIDVVRRTNYIGRIAGTQKLLILASLMVARNYDDHGPDSPIHDTESYSTDICCPGGDFDEHASHVQENMWPEIWSSMSKNSQQREKQH